MSAEGADVCNHYWAWVSPAGTSNSARICMTCHQPDPEWLNQIAGESEWRHPRPPDMTGLSTLRGMAKPNMVMRSLRVPEKLWEAAKAKADQREENISDVIREALERYVKRR